MMIKKTLFFVLLLSLTIGFGQEKKILTHDDYDLWKSVKEVVVSDTGNVIATSVVTSTGRGDGYLQIYNVIDKQQQKFFNGRAAKISSNGEYVVFLEKPAYELTRQEKKKKLKKEEQTKNKLFIFNVEKNILVDSFLNVKSFILPEKYTNYVIIEHFKKQKPKKDSTQNTKDTDTLKYGDSVYKNNFALVYHLKTQNADTLKNIKSLVLAKDVLALFYSKTKGKKKGDLGVYKYNFENAQEQAIDTGHFAYDKLAVANEGTHFSYISAKDSLETDSLKYELYLYYNNKLEQLTDSLGKNIPEGWTLNIKQQPYFSEHSQRFYYFTNPKKEYDIDTTLLKEEIPEVEVWNYQDKMVQPEQKSRLKELKNKGYLSCIDLSKNKVVHLQDEKLEGVLQDKYKEQQYVLAYTQAPYSIAKSWEYPQRYDCYSINTWNGAKKLIVKGATSVPYLTPDGGYAVYFKHKDGHWWAVNLQSGEKRNLTKNLGIPFYDVEHDEPSDAGAYGMGGFDKEGYALIYDQFDIWKIKITANEKPVNLTQTGRKHSIQYRTLRLDKEDRRWASYYKGKLLLTAFNKKDKTSALYTLETKKRKKKSIIKPEGMKVIEVFKAKNADFLLYRKQNFQHYPDLFLYKDGVNDRQLTDANPQQKDFKWGTSEAFQWTAFDGTLLDGILYKPEDFDSNKKYPVILYFYERRSDRLNRYYSPQPSASIVNMSYLVSNDYLVFVPDIVYKEGHPGESAYNCIVSGAEAVRDLPYVDANNMAIQGQSWGGYQVAYLVTRTNMFKAAMAGAPVSNMTSAYGGIRWKSGLSREFQYEKTQSRLGKTLWDGFDLYIENSPLFSIPKIQTPLLMMHNDKDGAVPYYQGIEMFMGMRRLGKPVWLLVYNNEQHNLKKVKNKQDLSIRMMQFFDHYLKGMPAPKWMIKGVSAVDKGKDFGYELE